MHDINRDKAKQIINGVMKQSTQPHTWLSIPQIGDLLGCYGIRFAETKLAKTAQETAAIAAKIGFPVVIKLESTTITHKTDVGGVKLNIKNEAEAKQAFGDIKAKLTELGKVDQMDGVMIQKMVTEGIEAIVGVSNDPSFGHLIMFGLGGVMPAASRLGMAVWPCRIKSAKTLPVAGSAPAAPLAAASTV